MRAGIVSGSRSNFYDRSVDALAIGVNQTYANHGITLRDTYTVPASKKAYLGAIMGSIVTTAAPAAQGDFLVRVELTDATPTQIWQSTFDRYATAAGEGEFIMCPIDQWVPEGYILNLYTLASANITFARYDVSVSITEFDA